MFREIAKEAAAALSAVGSLARDKAHKISQFISYSNGVNGL